MLNGETVADVLIGKHGSSQIAHDLIGSLSGKILR
jgi:hypothetical protein